MAIEFPCTVCGQTVRTPDSAVGKKGRCPSCQTVMQIPLASMNVAPLPSTTAPAAPAPKTSDTITFACAACGNIAKAPAAMAGKKGRCAKCKEVVNIPLSSESAARPTKTVNPAARAPAPPQQRPAQPGLTALRPAESAGLQPLAGPANDLFGGLSPLGAPGGLQPLNPPGLQPLGAGADPFGGLAPLGGPSPFDSLNPAAGNPFGGSAGSAPLGGGTANPFGGGNAANPFGPSSLPNPYGPAAGGLANAYASPSMASYKTAVDDVDPGSRRGFPWQREQSFENFTATVKRVLFGFPTAFQTMRLGTGIGPALGFLVGAQILAGVIQACYSLMLQLVLLLFVGGDNVGTALIAAFIGFGLQLVGGSLFAAFGAMVGSFLWAGVFHICLLIVGAANRGFDTTYQVVCYSLGACVMLVVIPILGPLVMLFLIPVVVIVGFMHAHATSGVRATFAVLLPFLTCSALFLFLFFTVFLSIYAAANGGN